MSFQKMLLTSLMLVATSAVAAPIDLKIMSFNVRLGTADDGEDSWDKRKDIAVEVIRQYAPDVIGTQECFDFQADYIVSQLPDYKWFGVGREADGSGERMAVIYNSKVVSPMTTENFWLSETPEVPGTSNWNSACNRMATAAKFYHLPTKQMFHFYNTHLDHRSEEARQNGMKVLCQRVESAAEDLPIILTGDFNSPAESSVAWETATQAGFKDAWNTADEKKGLRITFNGFKGMPEDKDRRIDWIMTQGPAAVSLCETVTYSQDGRFPSDHFPIFARILLNPETN